MDHFISNLLIFSSLLAILFPLISNRGNGKWLHAAGISGSALMFLYSLLPWLAGRFSVPSQTLAWLPALGAHYAVGADSLSLTLVVLTTFLLLMACIASVSSITKRLKLYYSMLFVLTTAVLGVFVARDLFLFFLFWELELIPMYLLISIWGGPRRDFAAMKFVIYTLFGSVFLVGGLVGFYMLYAGTHGAHESVFLFDTLQKTVQSGMGLNLQILFFLAFFTTFAIKLPVVPFHTWLPDAHVEAPTPVSMLLAGILLKMGAYGMLRFCFGFFPQAAQALAPILTLLAVINIVYTAGVALVQSDLKKLIAYSSVSHMGFVLLGLAALNPIAFNGAVFVMVSHGVVSAALFMCVGTLYLRTHTRQITEYGGFATQTPVIFYFFLLMSMASLGLPLLISFAGESLIFYGAYLSNAVQSINLGAVLLPWNMQQLTTFAALGIVIGAAYLLWMLQRVFCGPLNERWTKLPDATQSEVWVLATLAFLVIGLGFFPQWLVSRFEPEVTAMAAPYRSVPLQQVYRLPAANRDSTHPLSTLAFGVTR